MDNKATNISRRNFLRGTAAIVGTAIAAPILARSQPTAFIGYNQIVEDIADVQPMPDTLTVFPGEQFKVGDYILYCDAGGNAGRYEITAVTTTQMTVEPAYEQTQIPQRHDQHHGASRDHQWQSARHGWRIQDAGKVGRRKLQRNNHQLPHRWRVGSHSGRGRA